MDTQKLVQIYVQWCAENNDTSITRFVQSCAKELQSSKRTVSPSVGVAMPSFVTSKVKNAVQSQFGGRGGVWAWCPVELVVEWLQTQEDEVKEHCGKYLGWIAAKGKAWIRYSGTNKAGTAFEVRIMGSRLDHKTLIIRLDSEYAETLEMMGDTPFKLGLEAESIKIKTLEEMVQLISMNNADSAEDDEAVEDNNVTAASPDADDNSADGDDDAGDDDAGDDDDIEFV